MGTREGVVTVCMEDLAGEWCTTDDRKVALLLNQACGNERVGKVVEKLWQCRFLQSSQA